MYRFALLFVLIFGVITQETNAAEDNGLNQLQSNVNLFIQLFGSLLSSNFSVPTSGVDECALETDKCLGNCSNGNSPDPGYTCQNNVQVDSSAMLSFEIINYAASGGLGFGLGQNLSTINNITYDVSENSVTYVYGLTGPLSLTAKIALAGAPGLIASSSNGQLSAKRLSLTASGGDKILSVKFVVPETVTVAFIATGDGTNETLRQAVFDILDLNSTDPNNAAAFIATALPGSGSAYAVSVIFVEPASADPKKTTIHKTRACTFDNSLHNQTGSTIMANANFNVQKDSITTTDSSCSVAGAAPVSAPAPHVVDVPAPTDTPSTPGAPSPAPAPTAPNAPASPVTTSGAASLAFGLVGFAVLVVCLLF